METTVSYATAWFLLWITASVTPGQLIVQINGPYRTQIECQRNDLPHMGNESAGCMHYEEMMGFIAGAANLR
jgi:hypothetical protein